VENRRVMYNGVMVNEVMSAGASVAEGENLGEDAGSGETTWDDVEKMAGRMGELREYEDERGRELVDEILRKCDRLNDCEEDDYDDARKDLEIFFRDGLEGYWSDRKFVEYLLDRLTECMGSEERIPAYALLEGGMPVEVIVNNEDYYDEMVQDGFDMAFIKGNLHEFYNAMSTTGEGWAKFQKDFVESGVVSRFASDEIKSIIAEEDVDENDLADLAIVKKCGLRIIESPIIYKPFYETGQARTLSEQRQLDRAAGQRLMRVLYENNLFDEGDLACVYKHVLAVNTFSQVEDGIIDAAIDCGMKVDSDDVDSNYWHEVSLQKGQNMVARFLYDSDNDVRQREFDFTKEPVMRLFVNDTIGRVYWGYYRDYQEPGFRDALRLPEFQDIIMSAVEKKILNDDTDAIGYWPFSKEIPSLFYLLVQDRQILDDMQKRNAFDKYPGCKNNSELAVFIDKADHKELTDEDVAFLLVGRQPGRYDRFALGGGFEDLFDASGNATPSGLKVLLREGIPAEAFGGVKLEFWEECFDKREYDVLVTQNFEYLARMGFSDERLVFLKAYQISPDFCRDSLTGDDDVNYDELYKYFDENGPKKEFWDYELDQGNFGIFARQSNLEMLTKCGYDDVVIRCLKGAHGKVFDNDNKTIGADNVLAGLMRFIEMDAFDWDWANDDDLVIKEAFGSGEVKDLALTQIRRIYEDYLNSDNGEFPRSLKVMADIMHKNDGAGPLTQIEAFLDFVGELGGAGEDGRELTRDIEQKMRKNHWDNQEKSNFYAISAEVLKASPDIYKEFAELFVNIPNKEDFNTFTSDIYPLFRAKLALLRGYEDHSNGVGIGYVTSSYESADMEELKNQLHNALLPFNLQELDPKKRKEGIDRVREIIFGEISELFQAKFGILPEAIPAELGKSDARAVEDMTLYLSNLAMPSERKKDMIGYFLALQLAEGGAWERMRRGEKMSPNEYLNVVSAFNVSQALDRSQENNPVNIENTRIENAEKLAAFREALQGEVTSMRVGNVQTIDLKLQNLMGNIEELIDPDLYTEKIDRQRVELLRNYPAKTIGRVAAAMYQRLNGRDVPLGDSDQEVVGRIEQILGDNNIEVIPDNIKTYFQVGLKGLKEPFSIMDNMRDSGTVESIRELQAMLMPPDEIARLFGKLGEGFKPQSGVMALGADLDFLENLVVKRASELSDGEIEAMRGYIDSIREKMAELNGIYERTIQNYEKMKKSMHDGLPEGVRNKIDEIDKIVTNEGEQSVITTTCTTEMATIIENMRACLSCRTKGINNDTNLTFGEGYKFYLYSRSGSSRGSSMADEIVYFVPIGEEEDRRMGFVMDQVYGAKNGEILMGHLGTVVKKARDLKGRFPEVPISIVLPDSSMLSCGVSMNSIELAEQMGLIDGADVIDIGGEVVTVPESGFGDHYIEFGDMAYPRAAGERIVRGIEISLKAQ